MGGMTDLFWDVPMTETELGRILREGPPDRRLWIIRRLLERGEWEEIWSVLTLADVEGALPEIRLRSPVLDSFWREAVAIWRRPAA